MFWWNWIVDDFIGVESVDTCRHGTGGSVIACLQGGGRHAGAGHKHGEKQYTENKSSCEGNKRY